MHKDSWRTVIALGSIAALTIAIGALTWPNSSNLPAYGETNPRNFHYRPGGKNCDPVKIAEIISVSKRAHTTDVCQEKIEEYRQKTNDLIQQTRAADAAQAQTNIANQQLLTSWLQTLGGFLTLFAAVGAAFYARQAAKLTQEGNRITLAESRPWISVECANANVNRSQTTFFPDGTRETSFNPGGEISLNTRFKITNVGKSPARNVTSWVNYLQGQWQLAGQPSIYGADVRNFYVDNLKERMMIKIPILMPGESFEHRIDINIDETTMSDPLYDGEPRHLRALPRLSFFISYEGDGINSLGETGKTFMFSLNDGSGPIDPFHFNEDSKWNVEKGSIDQATYIN